MTNTEQARHQLQLEELKSRRTKEKANIIIGGNSILTKLKIKGRKLHGLPDRMQISQRSSGSGKSISYPDVDIYTNILN